MVIASHDRYLIERVTDHVYGMFGDGRLVHLPGGVDEYLSRIAPGGNGVRAEPAPAPAATTTPPPSANLSATDVRTAKKELARLERTLAKIEERSTKLHAEMAANATDYTKISALDEELRGLGAERERTEAAWLAAAEASGE